jgi:glycosyltransferase involved in cell wall biosynthesis
MKLIFTSYTGVPAFDQPELWLQRIGLYTGILESLALMHEVTGIERINYEGEFSHKGVRYYFVRQLKKTVFFPRRIHSLVKQIQPDVVFINGFIFPLQLIQLRLKMGRRLKIIVINRSEKPGKGYRKILQRWADRCVNAYLFTSAAFGYRWVEEGIIHSRDKIHEIFHGSSVFTAGDKAVARQQLNLPASPVYLWVGRLDANKDPLTVIKAFIEFLTVFPAATLCMIYHEEELLDAIKKSIGESSIAKAQVRLIGKLPHPELETWYRAADFIVSASHYEGGGIAVCEAMSCGAIPVVTDIDSFRILTGNGDCGILFEPGNSASLLQALHRSAAVDLNEARKKVLSRYHNHFSFEAIGKKISLLLDSLFPVNQ